MGFGEIIFRILDSNWSVWPIVVLAAFCLLEKNHKEDISSLIKRISLVEGNGYKAQFNSDANQEIGDDSNLEIPKETLKIYYKYEKIYNRAYRSQIEMLFELKKCVNMAMEYRFARNYFNEHKKLVFSANQTVPKEEKYFVWMEKMGLIEYKNDNIMLTEFGNKFLTYIFEEKYNYKLKLF